MHHEENKTSPQPEIMVIIIHNIQKKVQKIDAKIKLSQI